MIMKDICKVFLITLICYSCICSCTEESEVSVLAGSCWTLSQIIKDGTPVALNSDIDKMSLPMKKNVKQ